MAFPRRLLGDEEQVVLAVRRHWWYFAPPAAALAVTLAAAVVSARLQLPELVQLLVAVLTLLALGRFVARYVRWATTRLVVTSERVLHRRGLMARQGREIPLGEIRAVSCRQSPGGRLLRCGDVVIEALPGGRQRFSGLPRPKRVRDVIRAGIDAHRRRMDVSPPGISVIEQLERLDELCRRGVLTRAELDAHKGRLLERM